MDACKLTFGEVCANAMPQEMLTGNASPVVCSTPNVDFNEITLNEKVGHGSYGVVYRATWRERSVAVKEFGANAEQKAIETEIKQLTRVCHANIIALYGISCDQSTKYLIMEFAEGGSLHSFLHGKVQPPYLRAHAMSWARQCAEGVSYLHAMKPKALIHRDLKPLNLLLTNKGRQLKIGDFGTVADKSTMMTNSRGSAAWMAPEVFEGSKYTEKCDIFSWAIVLWEVLSRKQPFKEIDNPLSIMWKIHKGERPPLLRNCPERIENLMTSCWKTAPEERPAMNYVVSEMKEIVKEYPGADKPIEYEFINQQIRTKDTLDSSSSTTSTQVTPTNGLLSNSNTSDASTPTNSTGGGLDAASNAANEGSGVFQTSSVRKTEASVVRCNAYSVIPEEEPVDIEHFNMTPSADAAKRYESMRNKMIASKPMPALTVHVDEFESNRAKSDGKERLTVTDTKSILMPTPPTLVNNTMTDMTNNNSNNSNSNSNNNNTRNISYNNKNNNNAEGEQQQQTEDLFSIIENDEDNENASADTENDDQSFTDILDPELRPEPPIPNNAESLAIYREHLRLAKEYLRVDTNLYYAQDFKEKLTMQMDRNELKLKQDLLDKIKEREQLLTLYNNVKKQANIGITTAHVGGLTATMAAASGVTATDLSASNESSNNSHSVEVVHDDWVVIQ